MHTLYKSARGGGLPEFFSTTGRKSKNEAHDDANVVVESKVYKSNPNDKRASASPGEAKWSKD